MPWSTVQGTSKTGPRQLVSYGKDTFLIEDISCASSNNASCTFHILYNFVFSTLLYVALIFVTLVRNSNF